MVLKGEGKDPTGKPVIHKISWSLQSEGSVRQLWQASSDREKTWNTVFDGIYRKKS